MNSNMRNQDPELTPDQERVRTLVRGLTVPQADPTYRERLRAQFVSGDFGQSAGESPSPRHTPSPVLRRRNQWVRLGVPLAVAAALVLMVGIFNQGPAWEVYGVGGVDHVLVDGQSIDCSTLSPLEAALHPGCRIQVPSGGQMEVISPGKLLVQLNGGLDVTLPPAPGRWFGRQIESKVQGVGTLRMTTADAFAGTRYRIHTALAELEVSGTTFAVISGPDAVDVCVLEGEIRASMPNGETRTIGSGRRAVFTRGKSSVDEGEMLEHERQQLSSLRARAATLIDNPSL